MIFSYSGSYPDSNCPGDDNCFPTRMWMTCLYKWIVINPEERERNNLSHIRQRDVFPVCT